MNHKQPICHESRDLGYARQRDQRERKITVILSIVLAVLLVALWRAML